MNMTITTSFINGKWRDKNENVSDIINPYTHEKIGEKYSVTSEEVEETLQTSFSNKKKVKNIPSHKRAVILKKSAQLLEERREYFASIISKELGKPLKNTLGEVDRSIETLELSGEEAKRLNGETLPGDASARGVRSIAYTHRVPIGVVAAITPFNAPLNLVCHKVGPAFAGGNVTILKPASNTTIIAKAFVELLLEAGMPEDAINLLIGGREVVQPIVSDDRVNLISLTGGLTASNAISKVAGIKKQLYELGGNAATIVHEDADINKAASMSAKTGYSNSGQSCISVQRIYVHKNVIDKFAEKLVKEVSKLKIGDPLDTTVDVGTMVDEKNADRIMNWIDEAVQQGAEILAGGVKDGATIKPTVLRNPPKDTKVVCEEVFGPIVSIIPFEDLDVAIQEADNSSFGLQVGLFTNKIDLAYQVANEMEVGGVIINGTSNFRLDHWPYGGVKDSGLGREGPKYTVHEMTESKMIVLRVD